MHRTSHLSSLVFFIMTVIPASAHPGQHAGMTVVDLARHLFEPDHVIFAGLAGLVGIFAYRAGRRAEARALKSASHKGDQHDSR